MTKEKISVSVIIPVYNAGELVVQTLESLIAQSVPDWEAIVIDDGSTDFTLRIASSVAEHEPRIRILNQPHQGVSAARNTGIQQAKHKWLLFLDGDDWIAPDYLEKMLAFLKADPTLDAAYCGFARVYPDGSQIPGDYVTASIDMFPTFTQSCIFAIHTCVVRRSIVEEVGSFDPSLTACEDWDLWQRIARAGARFGSLNEVLALYRVRAKSASTDSLQMLRDGLSVIQRGHMMDPRVPTPLSTWAAGMPRENLAKRQLNLTCWFVGFAIGSGQDVQLLLNELQNICDPGIESQTIASLLYLSAVVPEGHKGTDWPKLWPIWQPRIHQFLEALERHSSTPGLKRRVTVALERMILDQSTLSDPITLELTSGTRVEITQPIQNLSFLEEIERAYCRIEMEGEHLGVIDLPVIDGEVSSAVLADAIAAEFSWTILKQFFHKTIYRELSVETGPAGLSLLRGNVVLADGLPQDVDTDPSYFHDQIGWLVFLQEIWSRPDWGNKNFYGEEDINETVPVREIEADVISVDIMDELADIKSLSDDVQVIYKICGTVIGRLRLSIQDHLLRASQLRVAITFASGYELCRAAVREGLLGMPFLGTDSLRSRLIASTKKDQDPSSYLVDVRELPERENISAARGESLIIGRRIPGRVGTSHSRRADLPAMAESELIEAARVAGEPVIRPSGAGHFRDRVVYAPEIVSYPDQDLADVSMESAFSKDQLLGHVYLRDHFESIFAASADPWKYTSDYERVKYEQTLQLLPNDRFDTAIEIGCAEGHFTRMLAPRVRDLIAADISEIALSRASARCTEFENIKYVQLDLTKDLLQGPFQLIVCSEMLYYVGDREALKKVIQKIANALRPGGYLLMAHAHLAVDEPNQAGFDWPMPFGAKVISDYAENNPLLFLKKEIRTPLYRAQLFQRPRFPAMAKFLNHPQITTLEQQPTHLLPEIASHVLWNGTDKQPDFQARPMTSKRLPILMYHRITPDGSSVLGEYCVTPQAFHDQLRYLSDAGYYSITLDQWHVATERKMPLPGKPILLTFDDGYLDFKDYAWPLLKRYGFSASVFLVADQVGKTNSWDAYYGESLPLLDWPDILLLQNEGIEFGSHTATHPHLTGFSPGDVVKEASLSRKIIQERLGKPVQAFSYPYGSRDRVVQHLVGACGYIYGLTTVQRFSNFNDSMLALPRIEVSGTDNLQQVIQKLHAG